MMLRTPSGQQLNVHVSVLSFPKPFIHVVSSRRYTVCFICCLELYHNIVMLSIQMPWARCTWPVSPASGSTRPPGF